MFEDYSDLDHHGLTSRLRGGITLDLEARVMVFSQGDRADDLYYLISGRVKLIVASPEGKEAVIAVVDHGSFFGESCLYESGRRRYSAVTVSSCTLIRLSSEQAVGLLRADPLFASFFMSYVLKRCQQLERALSNHLLYLSEQRLAGVLLSIAPSSESDSEWRSIGKLSQEVLADMTGTTRARVSYFMNQFRKRGLVKYKRSIEVNTTGLTALLGRTNGEIDSKNAAGSRSFVLPRHLEPADGGTSAGQTSGLKEAPG